MAHTLSSPPPYNPVYTQTYTQYPPETYTATATDTRPVKETGDKTAILVSLLIAGLAAFATYYALSNGMDMYDMATRTREFAISGTLIYLGIVGSGVAVANLVIAYFRSDGSCGVNRIPLSRQAAASVFAPIIAIPFALMFGCQVAMGRR